MCAIEVGLSRWDENAGLSMKEELRRFRCQQPLMICNRHCVDVVWNAGNRKFVWKPINGLPIVLVEEGTTIFVHLVSRKLTYDSARQALLDKNVVFDHQ